MVLLSEKNFVLFCFCVIIITVLYALDQLLGKDRNPCLLVGNSEEIHEGVCIMLIITHVPQHGRDPILKDCSIFSSGKVKDSISFNKVRV